MDMQKNFLDYWCSFIINGNPNNIKKLLNYKLLWNNFNSENILCFGKKIYFTNLYNIYDKQLYKNMNKRLNYKINDYIHKSIENDIRKILDNLINNAITLST